MLSPETQQRALLDSSPVGTEGRVWAQVQSKVAVMSSEWISR